MLRGFAASILRLPKVTYEVTKRRSTSSVKLGPSFVPLTALLAPFKLKHKPRNSDSDVDQRKKRKPTAKLRKKTRPAPPTSVQPSVPLQPQPASSDPPSKSRQRSLARALCKLRSIPRKLRCLSCIADPSKTHEVNEGEREDEVEHRVSETNESGTDPASQASALPLSSTVSEQDREEIRRYILRVILFPTPAEIEIATAISPDCYVPYPWDAPDDDDVNENETGIRSATPSLFIKDYDKDESSGPPCPAPLLRRVVSAPSILTLGAPDLNTTRPRHVHLTPRYQYDHPLKLLRSPAFADYMDFMIHELEECE